MPIAHIPIGDMTVHPSINLDGAFTKMARDMVAFEQIQYVLAEWLSKLYEVHVMANDHETLVIDARSGGILFRDCSYASAVAWVFNNLSIVAKAVSSGEVTQNG